MQLHELLDHILSFTERIDPALCNVLQPGYPPEIVQSKVPWLLPSSVVELYGWHNGVQDKHGLEEHPLFYYHHFLSIEDAYHEYQELMSVNQKIVAEGYSPHLFPLFSYQGEWYMVYTKVADPEYGSIWFVHEGEFQVYDSLTTMLEAISECYAVGAYELRDGEVIPHKAQVAAIKAQWNRCRWLPHGTTLEYHP